MIEKEQIILFGASQHTRYTIDIVEQEGKYAIVGILDFAAKKGTDYGGYPILGNDDDLPEIITSYNVQRGLVTIGDNFIRKKVATRILANNPDFKFVSAIHPSAVLGKNVMIGEGSVLMAGAIVNNDTLIGKHSFVATKASIDHDSILGDFSSLSPGVTTGGTVKIGVCSAIGIGASILHGMTIGDHTIVGAASLVVKDIEDLVVAYGSPAKVVRQRREGDAYL